MVARRSILTDIGTDISSTPDTVAVPARAGLLVCCRYTTLLCEGGCQDDDDKEGRRSDKWNSVTILSPVLETHALQSTHHELIPARNESLAAMQGSASGSNVSYYAT
jgi:hypothetical protein